MHLIRFFAVNAFGQQKIHTLKLKSLNFAGNLADGDVLTWLQRVCFSYVYLCLFDDIRKAILDTLSLKSIVDNAFDPTRGVNLLTPTLKVMGRCT